MTKLDKLIDRIIDIATGKETMIKVATEAANRIRTRTRVGKGVYESEGNPKALPKLKKSTVNIRENLKEKGKLTGPGARPGKSTLTRSGDMLESLEPRAEEGQAMVVFGSKEEERKAREVQNLGFTFMNVSKPEVNALKRIIKQEIKKRLR